MEFAFSELSLFYGGGGREVEEVVCVCAFSSSFGEEGWEGESFFFFKGGKRGLRFSVFFVVLLGGFLGKGCFRLLVGGFFSERFRSVRFSVNSFFVRRGVFVGLC